MLLILLLEGQLLHLVDLVDQFKRQWSPTAQTTFVVEPIPFRNADVVALTGLIRFLSPFLHQGHFFSVLGDRGSLLQLWLIHLLCMS